MSLGTDLGAVTFDCWGTLLYEPDAQLGRALRGERFLRTLRAQGLEVTDQAARTALEQAWHRHWQDWTDGVSSGSDDMAGWALESFGIRDPAIVRSLGHQLAEASLEVGVRALDGARETLDRLAAGGLRRALICDTGFSPGHIVRELLEREGLLEGLEVLIFSDEIGVPKPAARMFRAALEPLDVPPERAVHVGDLRRTDIAGARDAGMRSVRIRWQNDDVGDLPEADVVVDSHAELQRVLELSPR